MHRCQLTSRLGRVARRLTVVAGFIGFLVVNTGFPLIQPVQRVGKDRSRPFMCQDRPCGCMSAEACLRGCCCFTASQRLAWAIENAVDIPAELLAAAQQESANPALAAKKSSCCESKHVHANDGSCPDCEHRHAGECSSGHDAKPAPAEAVSEASSDEDTIPWEVTIVIGRFASHCRGMGPLSSLAFIAVPLSEEAHIYFDDGPTGTVVDRELTGVSFSTKPPTRPPRA